MRLKEIIRAKNKVVTDWGHWTHGKRMPATAFPLSKNKSYRLRNAFSWRIIKFELDGFHFRLLVAYRTDKEEFLACLGMDDGGDTVVLARLDYHASHAGWHVHTSCGQHSEIPAGRTTWPGQVTIPQNGKRRSQSFAINDEGTALMEAVKRYRLPLSPPNDLFGSW